MDNLTGILAILSVFGIAPAIIGTFIFKITKNKREKEIEKLKYQKEILELEIQKKLLDEEDKKWDVLKQ